MKNEKRKENHYRLKEVKKMFQSYRDLEDVDVSDEEYNIFCKVIRELPKEIVSRIEKEIYFVILSLQKCQTASYHHLEAKDLREKKAIIFIPPIFFKCEQMNQYFKIFHEVAHYILGHKDIDSLEEREKHEDAAKKLALNWMRELHRRLSVDKNSK
jgi:hypothetical protein